MSSTNKTPNYNLPQFLGTDVPAWLGDINPAFADIDSGMESNKNAAQTALNTANGANNAASAADTKADKAQATAGGAVSQIGQLSQSLTMLSIDSTITENVEPGSSIGTYYNSIICINKLNFRFTTKDKWTKVPATGYYFLEAFTNTANCYRLPVNTTTTGMLWVGSVLMQFTDTTNVTKLWPVPCHARWDGTQTHVYIDLTNALENAISATDKPLITGTAVTGFTGTITPINMEMFYL